MAQMPISPVVLIILDGWGYREESDGNAIANANTPVMTSLWDAYPSTLIHTSGKSVGLPEGQMGNSEVGHLNIGAGRMVPQELVRISDAVEDGTLQSNSALVKLSQELHQTNGTLHLIGLCSNGGVHSHLSHLEGLLKLAKAQNFSDVCIHVITDGRDTRPTDGLAAVQQIEDYITTLGVGRIATIGGRYYSMDRDHRWDRTQRAYEVLTQDGPGDGRTAGEILQASYDADITDEFVDPLRVTPGAVKPGDGVIFFNFRPDRARQLTQVFVDSNFNGFVRERITPLAFLTFTQYDPEFPVLVAFEPQDLTNILGEVVSRAGLRQLRTAETEKYAHVTYFLNGGIEEPFPGEDREMVPSPGVPTYDRTPGMSADAVTQGAIAAVEKGIYSLIVLNYANPDMVGHTGKMEATIKALETVDRCLGQFLESIVKAGGTTLITADHGNAELMWDEQRNPWTAHTTNPVPFILVEGEKRKIPGHGADVQLRSGGTLADIAPTILQILQIEQPVEMTGRSLLEPADLDVRANRSPVRVSL